MDDIFVVSQK